MWVLYRRAQFTVKQTFVLLELKLPREVLKSPQAAEFFINGMNNNGGEANWFEKYWKGQMRTVSSLEIVSIDGVVHFYIWTRKGEKNKIEANLYSQFQGIEVYEVPDYTLPVVFDPATMGLAVTEFELTKPDAYPIKTYIDYGMDKNPKEEYKIDPLTPLIEFLGSIGRGHQAWIQIIIRAHKAEDKNPEGGDLVDMRWKKGAQKEIDEIIKKAKGEAGPDGKIVPGTGRTLNDTERETIKALSRSVSKLGFDVGIRALYIAQKDIFSTTNFGGVIGGITHFNSEYNSFKPARGPALNYKWFFLLWKSRPAKTINKEKQDMLDAYKKREYFYAPHKRPHFVLNTEELATLYHFPGIISMMTPTLERIGSKKAEAPSNLPQ